MPRNCHSIYLKLCHIFYKFYCNFYYFHLRRSSIFQKLCSKSLHAWLHKRTPLFALQRARLKLYRIHPVGTGRIRDVDTTSQIRRIFVVATSQIRRNVTTIQYRRTTNLRRIFVVDLSQRRRSSS